MNGVTGFNAGVGYDLCTGLGTPDVDLLVRSFVAVACPGDCNGDGVITIDEVVTGINITLDVAPLSHCPGLDANGDGLVTVDELLQAVSRVLNGC